MVRTREASKTGSLNNRIALKFDRHIAVEVPVKFQRDGTVLITNLAAPRLCEILQYDVSSDIETGPGPPSPPPTPTPTPHPQPFRTPYQNLYHALTHFREKKGYFFNGRRKFAKIEKTGVILQAWVCENLKKGNIWHIFIIICLFRMVE